MSIIRGPSGYLNSRDSFTYKLIRGGTDRFNVYYDKVLVPKIQNKIISLIRKVPHWYERYEHFKTDQKFGFVPIKNSFKKYFSFFIKGPDLRHTYVSAKEKSKESGTTADVVSEAVSSAETVSNTDEKKTQLTQNADVNDQNVEEEIVPLRDTFRRLWYLSLILSGIGVVVFGIFLAILHNMGRYMTDESRRLYHENLGIPRDSSLEVTISIIMAEFFILILCRSVWKATRKIKFFW